MPEYFNQFSLDRPMTQAVHDTFTKEWMKQMLSDYGDIEVEVQVRSEVRTIDVLFFPAQHALHNLADLGLLGQILVAPAAIEAFRNAVPEWEIHNCRNKRFALHNALAREAKQNAQPFPKHQHPDLWITTPTFSKTLQKSLKTETREPWGQGIYFLCDSDGLRPTGGHRTAVIAIHELPKTRDTLLLRLLGKGKVQTDAIQALLTLPPAHPYRQITLENIAILRINLEMRQNKSKQIKEVIMNLSPAYEKWRQETLAEGEARGEARGEAQGQKYASISIARSMLQEGLPIDLITKVTGLASTEIAQLRS
jgi:hypothetical protein